MSKDRPKLRSYVLNCPNNSLPICITLNLLGLRKSPNITDILICSSNVCRKIVLKMMAFITLTKITNRKQNRD